MKLEVHVVHHGTPPQERHELLIISCGSGSQTLKWLALNAAARYARPASGRLRAREDPAVGSGEELFMPTDIRRGEPLTQLEHQSKDGNEFLNPSSSIKSIFQDGDAVSVWLCHKRAVDQLGRPVCTRWEDAAFMVSASQRHRATRALEEEKVEQDERKASLEKEEVKRKAKLIRDKAQHVRRSGMIRREDEGALTASFNEDWAAMHEMRPFTSLCRGPEALFDTREAIKESYGSISELFKTCAASSAGAIGSSSTLEEAEFGSFVHGSAIFKPHPGLIDFNKALFFHCLDPTRSTPSMNRPLFLVSLAQLAFFRYIDAGKSEGALSRKLPYGSVVKVPSESTPTTLATALQRLVHEYLEPMIAKGGVGNQVSSALRNEEVLAVLFDHEADLREKFEYFVTVANLPTEAITLMEFGALVAQADLLGSVVSASGEHLGDLTVREVRQAFAGAQGEQAVSSRNDHGGLADDNQEHLLHMDFTEFVEALLRVAFLKYEHEGLPVHEKVRLVCAAVGAMVPRRPYSRASRASVVTLSAVASVVALAGSGSPIAK